MSVCDGGAPPRLYGGEPTVMFYAGDDAEAKSAVRALVAALGFDPVDAGPLARAQALERLASLFAVRFLEPRPHA